MHQMPPRADLFQVPYQQPPPGLVSDFRKPSDLYLLFHVLISMMMFITTVFVLLRIRARIERDERWRIDDSLVIATWISTNSLGILLLISVQRLGRPTWDVSTGFLVSAWPQRILVCMAFVIVLSLLMGKLSILALNYRFFGHLNRVRPQTQLSIVLCLPLLAAMVVSPVLAAPPLGTRWGTFNPHTTEGGIVSITTGVINLLVDCIALCIPIPCILSMNLSLEKRLSVLTIFLTVLIAIAADTVGMHYRVRMWKQVDPLRDGMIVGICSFVEASISIVCSSMPCAAKVWKIYVGSSHSCRSLQRWFRSSRKSHDCGPKNSPNNFHPPPGPMKAKPKGLYSIESFPSLNPSRVERYELTSLPRVARIEHQLP